MAEPSPYYVPPKARLKSPTAEGSEIYDKAGIAPAVAPSLIEDVPEAPAGNLGPNPENVVNYAAQAREARLAAILGPNYKTQFNEHQIQELEGDTPTWRTQYQKALQRVREQGKSIRTNPDSPQYEVLNNPDALQTLGVGLLAEEADAEKRGGPTERHAFWEAKLAFNYVNYVAYMQAAEKQGDRIRNTLIPIMPLFSAEGLKEGVGMAARNFDVGKGLSWNRVKGPVFETPQAAAEAYGRKIKQAKNGLFQLVKMAKDGKDFDKKKVDRILALNARDPNYFTSGMDGSTQFMKDLYALSPAERAEVLIGLNHEVVKDKKTGKLRPMRASDEPNSGRPMSLLDFDEGMMDDKGFDETGLLDRDEMAQSFMASRGASMAVLDNGGPRQRAMEASEARAARVKEGKIDPADWFQLNRGKGFLADVPDLASFQSGLAGGMAYNAFVSPFEQKYTTGVFGLYNILASNTRPNSFFWDVKNQFLNIGKNNWDEKIAYHAASMERNKWEEEAFGGDGQKGLKMPIADTLIETFASKEKAAELRQSMRDYGYVTPATAELGFMTLHPAMAASKMAAVGVNVNKAVRTAEYIGLSAKAVQRVENVVKGVAIANDWLMSGPVKVAGFTAGLAGRAMVYVPAALANPLAKVGGRVLHHIGAIDDPAKATAAAKRGLLLMGFTDTFLMGDWSRKMAFVWGFGKGAEGAGHLLGKYLDWRLDGYGFRGAMAAAANDSSISALAQATARRLSQGGIFTKWAWDTAKGMYGGAGVMYSIGVMKGDHTDAMQSISTGLGMGGLNAGLHGGHAYFKGHTQHAQARKMLEHEANSPNFDPVTRATLLEKLDLAERNGDYEFAPRLVSAIERTTKLGVGIVVATTEALKNNANLRGADIIALPDTDMTVTYDGQTRTFQVKALHAEVEALRVKIKAAQANNDAVEVNRLGELLSDAQRRRFTEINEYLDAVRRSGNQDLKDRVGDMQRFAGVYHTDIDGARTIYLNLDDMDSTTGSHEVFHGLQKLIGLTQAQRTFNQFAFGIKFGTVDENGNRGETVFEKGLFDAEDLKNAGTIYINRFGGDAATRTRRLAELDAAVAEMKALGAKGMLSESSVRTINRLGEEMGARWFENFISRKPQDYLYFGGKYGKMRTLSDKLVMYFRHNNVIDANAAGIKSRIGMIAEQLRSIENRRRTLDRYKNVYESVRKELTDAVEAMRQSGMSDDAIREAIDKDANLKRKRDFYDNWNLKTELYDAYALTTDHGLVNDMFRDADGNNLVVPSVDAYFESISGLEGNTPLSLNLNLNEMSGLTLEGHLAAMGLEHYGYRDSSGVTRLKDRKVIEQEEAARGKRTEEILVNLPSTRSGVVRTVDKNGTVRYVGALSDEALTLLTNDEFDLNGTKHRTLPAGVAIKMKTMRDAVLSTIDPNNTDFNVYQFLYSGLSKEVEGGPRVRKPHGHVEQTFRRVLPYRMELVATTKDRNGNKIPAVYEMMVTAIDLNVIYGRMANEYNATYTLPSGKVVQVKDLFGGDMAIMHSYFKRYLTELSRNNPRPTAETFGGGEVGEAIRDVMYRVLGTIPEGGHDFTGKPLAYNNPIIKPFEPWERGPDFAFTTFRVDLMSHLEQIADRITFNDAGYGKALGNYQPPKQVKRVALNEGRSFLHTYEGDFEPNAVKNRADAEPVNKATYNILESDGKYIVSSEQLMRPMTFSTLKSAEDYIHMDYQRASILINSGVVLNQWNLKGVAVGSTGDGNYMLIDNFSFKHKVSPTLNKAVNEMTFSTFAEAFKAAANVHNKMALEALDKSTALSKEQKELTRFLVTSGAVAAGPEAFPLRVEIGNNGEPLLEPKTKLEDGETVPDLYTDKDIEVKKGLAQVGQQKMKVSYQKMDYNWLKSLTGDANVKANDPLIKAHGRTLGRLLAKEMVKFINDPEILAGYRWYLDFSERGHKVFGNMFPVMCEALGATSARTPVKTNFEQATEFMRKFSLGHYDEKIKVIVGRLEQLHAAINQEAPAGERNEFTKSLIRHLVYKSKLGDTDWRRENGIPDVTLKKFTDNPELLPDSIRMLLEKEVETKLSKKDHKPTEKQRRDYILEQEKNILSMEDTILLREGDKKFNMNSDKVTMVAVAHFLQKSDGPKTIQFSQNLMGTDLNATIDVWAARTISRLVHSKMLKSKMWRIRPSMENAVDGEVIRMGTKNMPIITGKGDFYLGQEAFRVATDILKRTHGTSMREFADLTPANLQAMLWFAEKKVWDTNGWTGEIGAEMSSFDAPLKRMTGEVDPSGVLDTTAVRRFLFGVSGTVDAQRVIGYRLNEKGETVPITVNAGYRRFPTPVELLKNMAAEIRRQFGDKTVALQVDQTIGGYGYGMEDSIYLSASMERGLQITLANDIAKQENNIRNAENNIVKKHGQKATASAEEAAKLETQIEGLRKDIADAKSEIERLSALKSGDASTPDALNQLPTLLDRVIALGKQYQQSDVLAHEVVGEKHPNARPMRTIKFDMPIDGEMATYFIETMNKEVGHPSYKGIYAFTMEPDARLTNRAKIEALSKQVAALEKESRGSSDLKRRHELDTQIGDLRRQILKEQKFTSMYAVSVPEFAWRFSNGSKKYTEHVETLTVEWAKAEMDAWSKGFDEAYAFTLAQFDKDKKATRTKYKRWEGRKAEVEKENQKNKKKKGFVPKKVNEEPIVWNMSIAAMHKEYVSTYAIADAGYDYFDLSSVSNQTTLKQNLDRYGQEILRGERNIDESIGHENDARNPDEAVRNNPSGVRVQAEGTDLQRSGDDAGGGNLQGQTVSAKAKRLTQPEALKWLRDRESKAAESEAGFLYGDADISMLVVKGPDGRPTNEVRVMERGLPVAKFNSLAEAQGYVTGRLTGAVEARSIPEALKINGKKFDVRAGVRALSNLDAPSNFGEREGAYDPWDSIFGYDNLFQPTKGETDGEPNPIHGFRIPKTPKNFRRIDKGRKPVVTPEQDRAYLKAIADGDMDLAKALYREVYAKSDYVSMPMYRGTKKSSNERTRLHLRNNDESLTTVWAFSSQRKAKQWAESRAKDPKDTEVMRLVSRSKGVPKGGNNSEWNASIGPDGYFDMSNKDHQDLMKTSVEGLKDHILTAAAQYPKNSSERKRYEDAVATIEWEFSKVTDARRNFINIEGASVLPTMKEFPELAGRNWLQKTLADEGFIGHLESEGGGIARDAGHLESRATYRTNDVKVDEFITYDDNGNVIPLSQRFDPTNPDIRYQPARFRPKVPKYVFGSESTHEKKMLAFPNHERLAIATGDRDSIIGKINAQNTPLIVYDPSEAYSGRVTMHLTELQKVMDEYTDSVGLPKAKVFFYIRNSNTSDSPYISMGRMGVGIVSESEWNSTVNGVAKAYGDKPFRLMPQHITPVRSRIDIIDELALTDLDMRYHANTSDGYLSYASAITRSSERNGPSISYARPVQTWVRMIKKATGSDMDPAKFVPSAEVQAKMEDIIANVGGLGYAELSARLYAVGAGTKYDASGRRTIGLKGDVVNTSGSLMSARLRGMGAGNTESHNMSYSGLNLSITAVARRIEQLRIERENGGTMTPVDRFRFKQAIADAEAFAATGGISRGGTNSPEVIRLRAFVQAYDPAKVSHFENFFNRVDQIYNPPISTQGPDPLVPPAVGDLTLRRVKANKSHDPYVVTDPQEVFYETVATTKQGFLTMRPHGAMETHSWISENEVYQPIKWRLIDAQRKGGIPSGEKQIIIKGQRGYRLNLLSAQYANDKDHQSVVFNRKDRDILVRQIGAFLYKAKAGTPAFELIESRIKALEEHHGKPFNQIYEDALKAWHKHLGHHGRATGLDGTMNSEASFWTSLFMSDFVDALAPLIEFDKKAFEEGRKLDPDIILGDHEYGFGDLSSAANAPWKADKFRPFEILRAFFSGKAGEGMNVFERGQYRTSFGGFPIANNRYDSIQSVTKGSQVLKAYVHDALIKGGMDRSEAAFQIRRLMDALKFLTYDHYSSDAEAKKAENELIINSVLNAAGLNKLAKAIVSQGNKDFNSESYGFGGRLYMRDISVTDIDPHARPDQDADAVQAQIMEAAKGAGLSDDTIAQAIVLLRHGYGSNLDDAIMVSSDTDGYADRDTLEAKKKMYEKGGEVDSEIEKILGTYGINRSHVQIGIHTTTPTRAAKALIDAVQRQIDQLSDMKASADRNGYGIVEGLEGMGYEDAQIQELLGDTYAPRGQDLTSGQEAKQKKMVDKEMARLKKLRSTALAEYTGAEGGKVSMKRKSLEATLAEGLKSGQIKDIQTLFQTLRSYGVKRVSAKDIMRYVQMTPDGQEPIPSDAATEALLFMNQGLAGTEAYKPESQLKIPMAITESKDFQLLMFLDAISGLEAEADPNIVSVIDPATRAWAKGRGQFNVSSDKGRYGYRTDGDMRTILEEHHHFLLQQNKSYRRIYEAMRLDRNSGKDFKDQFEQVMREEHKTLEDMLAQFEKGDLEQTFRLLEGLSPSHVSALTNTATLTPQSRAKVGERVASAYVGGKAILLLGQLWMNALGQNRRNFAFGEKGVKALIDKGLAKNEQGLASSGTEASAADLMFNPKFTPSESKAGNDPSMISMDRFYYAGMEGDYGFKNLVEFAAHALNDHDVQGLLSRMKPVTLADGRDPMAAAVETLRSSKNSTFKGYGERLSKVLTTARTLLDQLVAVIKVMAGFKQSGNHSGVGTDYSREQTRKNTQKALGERTALEQAIEAASLVHPRHKGQHRPTDAGLAEAEQRGMTDVGTSFQGRKRETFDATSGDFKEEQILKYLGRVNQVKPVPKK